MRSNAFQPKGNKALACLRDAVLSKYRIMPLDDCLHFKDSQLNFADCSGWRSLEGDRTYKIGEIWLYVYMDTKTPGKSHSELLKKLRDIIKRHKLGQIHASDKRRVN